MADVTFVHVHHDPSNDVFTAEHTHYCVVYAYIRESQNRPVSSRFFLLYVRRADFAKACKTIPWLARRNVLHERFNAPPPDAL